MKISDKIDTFLCILMGSTYFIIGVGSVFTIFLENSKLSFIVSGILVTLGLIDMIILIAINLSDKKSKDKAHREEEPTKQLCINDNESCNYLIELKLSECNSCHIERAVKIISASVSSVKSVYKQPVS